MNPDMVINVFHKGVHLAQLVKLGDELVTIFDDEDCFEVSPFGDSPTVEGYVSLIECRESLVTPETLGERWNDYFPF